CEPVRLVPCVAEHVGEESLDDSVPTDRRDGGLTALGGQLDALVRLVIHELAVGQTLDRRRYGPRRQAEALGEDAGVGVAVLRQAVDRLQGLAIAFGEGVEQCFDPEESRFWLAKMQPGPGRAMGVNAVTPGDTAPT